MTVNNRLSKYSKKKCFKGYQMIYIIFVTSILMISSHIVFNNPFDLMYDICYPLPVKTTFFCFCSGYC